MPRFFFHTVGDLRQQDTQGTVLADRSAARQEAVRVAGALLNDAPELLAEGRDFRVEVSDLYGKLLFTIVTHDIGAAIVD